LNRQPANRRKAAEVDVVVAALAAAQADHRLNISSR
jgi:hypothetical protein